MESIDELDIVKKQLTEAQAVAESFKNDLLLEREVSHELARRNDSLLQDLAVYEERMKSTRKIINELESNLKLLLCCPVGKMIDLTHLVFIELTHLSACLLLQSLRQKQDQVKVPSPER